MREAETFTELLIAFDGHIPLALISIICGALAFFLIDFIGTRADKLPDWTTWLFMFGLILVPITITFAIAAMYVMTRS